MHDYKLADLIRHSGVSDTAFLEVLDQIIKPSWAEGPWVAGGSIRRMLAGTDPLASDFDIFFRDPDQKDAWVARMEADHEVLEKIENDWNTTLKVKVVISKEIISDETGEPFIVTKELTLELQAVHVDYYANPQAVIDTFDYTICQFVTDGVDLSVGQYSLWDLARKKLVIHKITYAIASMRRMLKYGKQGFGICGGMMAEFLGSVVENPETIDMNFKYID
jgi:hypothetical protein